MISDPRIVIAVAFLNFYNSLLSIIPDSEDDLLDKIDETIDHINKFLDGEEDLDIDKLQSTANDIIKKIKIVIYK